MSEFEGKTALVTGGAGFIGSAIVDSLLARGASVTILDDMSNGSMDNLTAVINDEKLRFVKGDVRSRESVKDALREVDVVFHQAAKVSVPFSVREPLVVMEVNAIGTTVLLDECRKSDVEKFVVASSSSVYGDTPTLPKIETMPTSPLSPYAVSKLAQETSAIAFYRTYGLNTTALRYFNVFGPRQRAGSYAGVMSIFIKQAFQNKSLTVEGDGQQTRDFTYIEDAVACNLFAASKIAAKGKIYNVGGGSRISIEDLAKEIIRLTKSESDLSFIDPRPGDVHDSLASIEAAKQDLGYIPSHTLTEGLQKTIAWAKMNQ